MRVLHPATQFAIYDAFLGPTSGRETAILNAWVNPWAGGSITVEVYSSADVLLCTVTRAGWTLDLSGVPKRAIAGAQTAYTFAAAGVPAKAILKNGAIQMGELTAGVNTGEFQLTANVASGVPIKSNSLVISSPVYVSSDGYWTTEPPSAATVTVGGSVDLSGYISGSGAPLMPYSAVPDGYDVLPRSVEATSAASTGATAPIALGPRDWGYQVRPDDSDGANLSASANVRNGGTSWQWFNYGLLLEWAIPGGVWRNEANVAQALTSAYAVDVTDTDSVKTFTCDVGWIVQRWKKYPEENWGIMLVGLQHTLTIGTIQTGQPVVLTVNFTSGPPLVLPVDVDVVMSPTTTSPAGASVAPIGVSPTSRAYLWWSIQASQLSGTIVSATLTVTTLGQFAPGGQVIRVAAMRVTDPQQPQGTAAPTGKVLQWTNGLYSGSDPTVLFGTQFPGAVPGGGLPTWLTSNLVAVNHENWQYARTMAQGEVVDGIQLPASNQYGLLCFFPEGHGILEPAPNNKVIPFSGTFPFAKASNNWAGIDEVYTHCRLIFGLSSKWDDGGKTPVGVHGKLDLVGAPVSTTSGNGGVPANTDGWSSRGLITPTPTRFNDDMPIRAWGTYAYHMNQSIVFGDSWSTANYPAGVMAPLKVYDIDMRVKINTPGQNDGVVQCWTNDFLTFSRTNVQWRPSTVASRLQNPALPGSVYNLNIAGAWSAIEYGGRGVIPPGQGGYIMMTNWVVSTTRIGKQP